MDRLCAAAALVTTPRVVLYVRRTSAGLVEETIEQCMDAKLAPNTELAVFDANSIKPTKVATFVDFLVPDCPKRRCDETNQLQFNEIE